MKESKKRMKKKQLACRFGMYFLGMTLSATGLTFSTIANLGIATITSIPYSIAGAFDLSFPTMMFVVNVVIFAIQSAIKLKLGIFQKRDWFQIPCVFVVTSLIDLFEEIYTFRMETLIGRILLMMLAIAIMGVGASMTVNMHFAPGPSDGIVYAVSIAIGKSMGTTKNIIDAFCIVLAGAIDWLGTGKISSIGLGTVLCMIFMGRAIAVFEYYCKDKILDLIGLTGKVPEKKVPQAVRK